MTDASTDAEGAVADLARIKRMIPHRDPFLLIDRVRAIRKGESAVGEKQVTAQEPYFAGHFPGEPIMPGVLMIEALAQTAGLLAFKSAEMPVDENTVIYFVGIDGARFKRPVQPGDQLRMEASILRVTRGIWKFAAKATVEGQIACEAELMCTLKQLD